MRVEAGAIAKKYLQQEFGIEVRAYLSQMGISRLIKWIGMRLKTTISSALMSIKWLRLTS